MVERWVVCWLLILAALCGITAVSEAAVTQSGTLQPTASTVPSLLEASGSRRRQHSKAQVIAARLFKADDDGDDDDDDDDDGDGDGCEGIKAGRKGCPPGVLAPRGTLTVVVNDAQRGTGQDATTKILRKALRQERETAANLKARLSHTRQELRDMKALLNATSEASIKDQVVQESRTKKAQRKEALLEQLRKKHYEAQFKRSQEEADKQFQAEQEAAHKAKAEADAHKTDENATASKELHVSLERPWTEWGGRWEPVGAYLDDDLCMVGGLVRGDSGLVAHLPPSCTPGGGRLTFATMHTDVPARVDILADGRVYHVAGGEKGWLTLNGLTFITKQNDPFRLTNGWSDFGGVFRRSGISKHLDKFCVASGKIKGPNWSYMGAWPDECKPNERLVMTADNGPDISRIDLLKDGTFMWNGGHKNKNWVSLDGMVWSPTGGAPLSLAGSWRNYGGPFRPAMVDRAGDYCVVSGLVINTNTWGHQIATLPEHCRPGKRMVFGGNNQMTAVRVDVWENGDIVYVKGKMSWNWLSLSNIHFTVAPKLRGDTTTPVGEHNDTNATVVAPEDKVAIKAPKEDVNEELEQDKFDHHEGGGDKNRAPPSDDEICDVETRLFHYTNRLRKDGGKKQLNRNMKLSDIARGHSINMGSAKTPFGHAGFNTRVKHFGFNVTAASENVFSTVQKNKADVARLAMKAWASDEDHKKNLYGQYNMMGVGAYKRGDDWWFTQIFAFGDVFTNDPSICEPPRGNKTAAKNVKRNT